MAPLVASPEVDPERILTGFVLFVLPLPNKLHTGRLVKFCVGSYCAARLAHISPTSQGVDEQMRYRRADATERT